jgi:hypothetical protein
MRIQEREDEILTFTARRDVEVSTDESPSGPDGLLGLLTLQIESGDPVTGSRARRPAY